MSTQPNSAPTAAFTVATANAPWIFQFDASLSSDSDGSISAYTWDFGDGQVETTSEPMAAHDYQIRGDYNVILTVEDDDGANDDTTQLVIVPTDAAASTAAVVLLML